MNRKDLTSFWELWYSVLAMEVGLFFMPKIG